MNLARKVILGTVIGTNSLWGQGEAKANLHRREQANNPITISKELRIEQLFLKREQEAIEEQRRFESSIKLIKELRQILESQEKTEHEIEINEQIIQKLNQELQGLNKAKLPIWLGVFGTAIAGSLLVLLSLEVKNYIELKKIIKEANIKMEKNPQSQQLSDLTNSPDQ